MLQSHVDRGLDAEATAAVALDYIARAAEDRLLSLLGGPAQEGELRVVEQLPLHLGDHVLSRPDKGLVIDHLERDFLRLAALGLS